ncbi:uncharacterized protein DSM5745_03684 [Aspergillus mulundensis]|uniref:Uncharacterized protein n=1 Tax=Aspergillus mulundensis TaxID=1810919 RepID=A0A3D8SLA3_9EURO|nr:hypothetical protein DSM5745_03684 [Aspergillus mulundensis]RDW87042.1 hypothetical protein DSM5745_03684 [Aspergillus mulundensis]
MHIFKLPFAPVCLLAALAVSAPVPGPNAIIDAAQQFDKVVDSTATANDQAKAQVGVANAHAYFNSGR